MNLLLFKGCVNGPVDFNSALKRKSRERKGTPL